MGEPRVFWLAKPQLDFDLNWKDVHVAEFPHKDTLADTLKVIEHSAYDGLLEQWNQTLVERNALKAEADSLRLLAESYRSMLAKLCKQVERYAEAGYIEAYQAERDKPSLSDTVDEARQALEGKL